MPVKSTDLFHPVALLDDITSEMPSSVIDMDSLYPNTEPVLSDDIWKKFEFDFPELSGFDDIFNELDAKNPDSALFPFLDLNDVCEIRNHDCMWAGHCGSKEHPADEPRLMNNKHCIFVPTAPVPIKTPAPVKPQMKQPVVTQQQSVLKPAIRAAAAASSTPVVSNNVHTPQTPPMSDDEEGKSKPTKVLQILHQAISECDLDEDSDLCDYFEDELVNEAVDVKQEDEDDEEEEEEEEEEDVKPDITAIQINFAAESDHSYHKDKNASMRTANLGIDTPSDSEEEIDVVSVGDKLSSNNRMVCSLPTNPSNRDRQQLQRRMATAITNKQISNGIKTILPLRKPATSPEYSPVKRKMTESRGVKRSRHYRIPSSSNSPYKRRAAYGNSSDSEPEPSEKRSLHNNMERQRRIDLRNAFEELRKLVPEVSKKERAAKVVILREAAHYCDHLGNVSSSYTRQCEELRRKQEWLRGRVSQLRRSLAAKR